MIKERPKLTEDILDLIISPDLEVRRLGITMLKQTEFYHLNKYNKLSDLNKRWEFSRMSCYTIYCYVNDFYKDNYWSDSDINRFVSNLKEVI